MLESQSVIQSQRIIGQVNQGMIVQGQGRFVQKRIFLNDAGTEDIFACEERKRAFVGGGELRAEEKSVESEESRIAPISRDSWRKTRDAPVTRAKAAADET